MDKLTTSFLDNLEFQLTGTKDLTGIPGFITTKTYLKGRLYSFKDHEFQLDIVSDTSQEVNAQKISQVGLSEVEARWGLAAVATIPHFSVIYTFPYGQDSENFSKTRVQAIVDESPKLKELADPNIWNVAIKKLGSGYIYFKGTNSDTAALSTPADCIIADEIDRSDPDILDQYESRLTHSKWQLRRNFSTPTVERRGIDAKMRKSRRYRNLCCCSHCSHWFSPDYYLHVKIPGWDRALDELDSSNIHRTRYEEATLLCPACGKVPDLSPAYRQRVLENPDDKYLAAGYYVSPFDAPKIVTVPQLLLKSTKYRRKSEFRNQNLGICSEEETDTITTADLDNALQPQQSLVGAYHMMGCDVGMTCHIVIGRPHGDDIVIAHYEKVGLKRFEERRAQLIAEYNVVNKVQDAQPYTDLILRWQAHEHNLYGAYYNAKAKELMSVREPDDEHIVRSVTISRNMAFDELLYVIKSGHLTLADTENYEDYQVQLMDMKKVPQLDQQGEVFYTWKKSEDGNDHYHHATLYCMIACRMPYVYRPAVRMPLVTTFRHREADA